MKLMLSQKQLKSIEADKKKPKPPTFNGPVAWWDTYTEGDCEGRTRNLLGRNYGHIVEIAFALAKNAGYVLEFERVDGPEVERQVYEATRREVHIRMAAGGTLPSLEADGVEQEPSNYYRATKLTLKK